MSTTHALLHLHQGAYARLLITINMVGFLVLLPTQIFRVHSTPLLYLDDGVLELHPGKTIDQINSKSRHRFGLVIGKELNPFRELAKVLVKGLSIYCRGPDDAIRTAVDRGQRHLFL